MMKDSKRKLVLIDEDDEHDDGVQVMDRKGENVILEDEDEEDDEDDLDEFENDGFIVDDEEEEEGEKGWKDRQKRKKKKKRKLVNDVILDDDDFELLRENKISGVVHSYNVGNEKFKRLKKAESSKNTADFGFSDDDASLYDGDAEEEEAASSDKDDEMADFIVFDELGDKKGVPRQQRLRENKPQQVTLASSLEEAGCTFGNADEILKRHLVKIVKPDNFNEFELDNYTTMRDYSIIKENDVPERMQIFEEISGPAPVDEMSRDEESSWILNQLAANINILLCKKKAQEESVMNIDLLKKINKEDIMRFLELRHLEKYDIPFIAMYRKEKCLSLLQDLEEDDIENKYDNDGIEGTRLKWHKILWAVNELDKKWLLLQKRKNALETCYNKRYEEESCTASDVVKFRWLEQQFDTIMKSLKLAETETDINDLDMKFMLHFPPPEEGVVSKFKLPKRRSEYSNCSKAGLWKLARKFGCSSEQFGLHLTLEKVGMEFWEDPVESPDVMASDFTCPMFETPEAVLNGARFMAAMEISCEPCVRKHVRRIFMDKAVVSTCPTQEGDKTIDSFHLFYGVKWLRDKPLDQFQEAQWLLILKAEEEKLLQVTINLPENVMNKLVTDSQEIYLTGSSHGSARLWDEQRKLIIQEAFLKVLLPSLEKEARALLITRAKSWLLMEYGKQLWKRVSIAPYQQKEYAAGQEEGIAPRVAACCWGPGKPPITFVMLNSSGQLLDVLEARSLSLRSQDVIDQQRKKYDQQRVFKFILNHRPNVIVLGAANVCCTWLKDDIEEIILQVEENTTDIGQMIDKINIVYGDESFAQLYENSKISSSQLPGQQGIVRRAVALARYLQNPLAMIATLCGPQKDIVSWKLNSLEHFLTPVEKYDMIEMVLVDVTNQVGMDVTFTMSHDWLLAPLQFVSGLGPQTAAFLHRELIGGKMVNNRYDLADCGLRSKKIFYNAVGFLRVRGNQLLSAANEFGLLDDTRIHPESYGLAESLSKAVHNDVAQTQPLTCIKNNPQLLNDFDIDDYADNYAIEQGENKRETLHDIKNELLHGFLDPRKPYEKPTKDELFFFISGKNEDAFAEGRIIQVTVRRVLSQRAFCALDFGLTGVIMKDDFLDGTDDFSLTDKLHEGDVVTCKIKQLEKSRFQVLLTCKESELKSCRNQNFHEIDPYYHEGKNKLSRQQGEACKNDLAKKQSKQRTINHPRFKNITGDEAMEFLSDKEIGEYVFHPSPRGVYYLVLTLKVYDGVYAHKDIIEGQKDHRDIKSLLHIGKKLKIGDSIFGDLDEVMDQYVNPLVTHLKTMINFKKFMRASEAEVDELLRAEKSEHPMRIVYCFGISYKHPGNFILSYIRTILRHEYIGVQPEGFKFRRQIFGKIEQVVAYFQRHIDDLLHGPTLTGNPSSGYSTGASMGSGNEGWQGQLNSTRDEPSTTGSRGRKYYSRDGDERNSRPGGLPLPNGGRGHGRGAGRGRGRGRGRGQGRGRGPGRVSSDNEPSDSSNRNGDSWNGNGLGGRSWQGQVHGNSWNGSDFGCNWSTNPKDKGVDGDGKRMFSEGNGSGGSWGANPSGGNSWNLSGKAGNDDGANLGRNGTDSQGILGSGAASGNDWLVGSSNFGGNGGWGNKNSSGGSGGGFNNDTEAGTTGWGSKSGKSSSFTGGGSGWS